MMQSPRDYNPLCHLYFFVPLNALVHFTLPWRNFISEACISKPSYNETENTWQNRKIIFAESRLKRMTDGDEVQKKTCS